MERQFEKHLPEPLNFILICQDFPSPSTLRLYLESKGCSVLQQGDTLVGVGMTAPFAFPDGPAVRESPAAFCARREVEIHAYMCPSLGWQATAHLADTRLPAYVHAAEKTGEDRPENLCVAFAKATNVDDALSLPGYRFFEEAMAYVRGAYGRHTRHAAAAATPVLREESKPVKESFYLTAREHEILKWVSEGKGCWETGAILGISERTVKFHLQNIYRKLNVVNRAQAITKAMRYALI